MAGPTQWFSQIISITKVALQTIPQRKGAALASILGIAGVVAVMVGVLSIAQGFRKALVSSASPETVMVLRAGADSELVSGLSRDDTRIIASGQGLSVKDGQPLASAELFVILNLPKRSTGTDANVPMRGVEPAAFSVRKDFKIVEGRNFQRGRNEVIVGLGAMREFAGLNVGSKIMVAQNEWEVVGAFSASGGISESEIWTDAAVLQPAYRRGDTFQAVYAQLESAQAFDRFKDSLTTDPRLNVKVLKQADYYAEQSNLVYKLITGLGTIIAALMGIGALFGALNTMFTAVAARTREIATLRALGFGRSPIVISVLLESFLLALLGGVIGGAGAYLAFDGFRTATINWQSFSQVAFAFDVNLALLIQGILYASFIGMIGGIFPAIRAARLPIAQALRET